MTSFRAFVTVAAGLGVVLLSHLPVASQEFGTITFPTSGAASAQDAFLTGVKALHSFQFDEAAVAFQQAQKQDPAFALAYWGEAMSHNHPLWAQQDVEAAKKVLDRLDPTNEGRVAKAKLPKEKALLEAMHVLYFGTGDKLARDLAYSESMARLYERWPEDHEIAVFYALSLLGTIRPGDTGFRRQALAASIAERVFQENPKHPGAAHFIIHAFDDPDHAPLGLTAARAYASIAPSAAHALHMPSHIFIQLGMWQDAAASNVVAYKAAVDLNNRMKLGEGREDFHTLSWLAYANTMLGKTDEAKKNVELAKQAADRNPANAGIRDGYLGMRARLISDTGQWEKLELSSNASGSGGHANMPGMSGMYSSGSATWTYIVGVSAARMGNMATAEAAERQLKSITARVEGGATSYAAKPHLIREKELGAVVLWAKGQKAQALELVKEAAGIEKTMSPPSGPPDPIKPALEFYGEMLLEAGQAKEAAQAFEQALLRTPKRSPSLLGLARAAAASGDQTTARQRYQELLSMPGVDLSAPALQEAQQALKAAGSAMR
jgi:tetratricopeptide (TPR) repeat protein